MTATRSTGADRRLFDVASGPSNTDGVLVLHLVGEFDGASRSNMSELVAQALARRPSALVLDLTEVDFLGSAALSVLVDARRKADQHGVELGVVAARRVTLLPLELTGLTRIFPVFPSVRDALDRLPSKHGDAVAS